MNKTLLPWLFSFRLTSVSLAADSATTPRERVHASCLIAFGRSATNDEIAHWTK